MRIEKEPSGSLKVELTSGELHQFHLTYNQLDYKEKRTRELLKHLVQHAGAMTGFSPLGKLMIEVFPAPGSGCVIYFTSLAEKNKRYRKNPPRAYRFANCGDLYAGVEALGKAVGKSDLYRMDEEYVLVLHSPQADWLKEFAQPFPLCSQTLAHLREHGRLLAASNAVERLLA